MNDDVQRILTSSRSPSNLVALYRVGCGAKEKIIKLPVVILVIQLIHEYECPYVYVVNTDKLDATNSPIERAEKVCGGMFISLVIDETAKHE